MAPADAGRAGAIGVDWRNFGTSAGCSGGVGIIGGIGGIFPLYGVRTSLP
jgi:hypothetical protein